MAYCGHDRDLVEAEAVHGLAVIDGQLRAVEHDAAADVAHAAVEADEAVAQRGLAAARLAGEAHDLAVGDLEA